MIRVVDELTRVSRGRLCVVLTRVNGFVKSHGTIARVCCNPGLQRRNHRAPCVLDH